MCNCKPKVTLVSKPNHEGYAVEVCKVCGAKREIPATYWAIMDFCNEHKIQLHVQSRPPKDSLSNYEGLHVRNRTVERVRNGQSYSGF
jgi:hypothetical protein